MKKILCSFLIFTMLIKPAVAQEQEDWDYIEVRRGESCPVDGMLFTYDGISNVLSKIHLKLETTKLEKDTECKKIQLNLETILKQRNSELDSAGEMYKNQLKIKQDKIDALQQESYMATWKIVGGTIAGVAVGVLITYFIVKL